MIREAEELMTRVHSMENENGSLKGHQKYSSEGTISFYLFVRDIT